MKAFTLDIPLSAIIVTLLAEGKHCGESKSVINSLPQYRYIEFEIPNATQIVLQ